MLYLEHMNNFFPIRVATGDSICFTFNSNFGPVHIGWRTMWHADRKGSVIGANWVWEGDRSSLYLLFDDDTVEYIEQPEGQWLDNHGQHVSITSTRGGSCL